MFVNSDFSELLRIFSGKKVKYLVIGGYAFGQYAEPRYTKDLNLWIATDDQNAVAVYQSLKEFGAPLHNLTEDDFADDGYFYQMGYPPVRIDILMGIPGIDFAVSWNNRVETYFEDLIVNFISREDLIAAKIASGRPQDLLDAEALSKAGDL